MPNKSQNIAVIGLGSFGASVARTLAAIGDRVLVIDTDPAPVSRLSEDMADALEADATDMEALSQCGITDYDTVLISIGEDKEASILAAMNAIDLGCKRVWVKAQTRTHKRILDAIGVHRVILPEQAYGNRVAQVLHNPAVEDFLSLGDDIYLVQMTPSDALQEALASDDFSANDDVCFVGVHAGDQFIAAADFEGAFGEGDKALLHGRREDLRAFADRL